MIRLNFNCAILCKPIQNSPCLIGKDLARCHLYCLFSRRGCGGSSPLWRVWAQCDLGGSLVQEIQRGLWPRLAHRQQPDPRLCPRQDHVSHCDALCVICCVTIKIGQFLYLYKREGREEREREGNRGKRRKERKREKGREAELCLTFKEMRRKAHILGLDSQCKIFQRLCLNQSLKSLKSLY